MSCASGKAQEELQVSIKEVEKPKCLMHGQSRKTLVDGARVKLLCKMIGEGEKLTSKSKVDQGRLPRATLSSKATCSACEPS